MFLYLIRHAQSVNNMHDLNKTDGHEADPRLSDLGHEQARITGELLTQKEVRDGYVYPMPTVVVASPMRRALQTARHIADAVGVKDVLVRHNIHECTGPGDDRLVRGTLELEFPNVVFDDEMPEGPWAPKVKEDHLDCEERAWNVVEWLRNKFGGTDETVALVTHGAFGSFLIGALVSNPFPRMVRTHQYNCAISFFDFDAVAHDVGPVIRCKRINDVAHLWPDKIT